MALHINNSAVERVVRELAALTGQTVTDTIGSAAKERLDKLRLGKTKTVPTFEEWKTILRSYNLQPINEDLTEDEILGYGPDGIPD